MDNKIKESLNSCFGEQKLEHLNNGFDYKVTIPLYNCFAYCKIYERQPLIEELRQVCSLYETIDEAHDATLFFVYPEGNQIFFGILAYWEYERMFINKNIHYRELVETNYEWLKMQLGANNHSINILPLDYIRVVKTISLNDNSIYDGEIIYMRKLVPQVYQMVDPGELSNSQRINRLCLGTPQSEYPNDVLDDNILKVIRSQYPQATVHSELLTCTCDLLKFRRKKDKLVTNIAIWFNIVDTTPLIVECLYYKDIFGKETYIRQSIADSIPSNLLKLINSRRDTYDKLSDINI